MLGKRKNPALGVYPDMPLAAATASVAQASLEIRDGSDRSSQRLIEKEIQSLAADFRSVALGQFEKIWRVSLAVTARCM